MPALPRSDRDCEIGMADRKPFLVGGLYFLLFALLFFVFTFWMARAIRGGERGGWRSGERIALIRIEGVIADSKEVVEELHRYRDDEGIKAILLRIDSPGGAVVPSQEIYDEVKKIREAGKKKVVTSMGTVAASGGYYIAAALDRIIANPGTLTGSIGVIMELVNVEGLLQKIGVEGVVIKSGENKDVGSPFRKMTDKEHALLQHVMDDVHAQFIEAVAEGRSLKVETVRAFADGRIFSGRQAKEIGLVDELGTLQDAIKRTGQLAGIQGEPQTVEAQKRSPLFDFLRNQFLGKWEGPHFPSTSVRLNYLLSF